MHNHNRFRVYVPLTKNNKQNYTLNDDGTLDIIGIASTTSQDLQKDIMLPSAINSMKKQLLTSNKNLHGDHEYGLFTGLLGSINKVLNSDNDTLKIGATILSYVCFKKMQLKFDKRKNLWFIKENIKLIKMN